MGMNYRRLNPDPQVLKAFYAWQGQIGNKYRRKANRRRYVNHKLANGYFNKRNIKLHSSRRFIDLHQGNPY